MFQFLIGRLRTVKSVAKRAEDLAFQFLIGRLRTYRLKKLASEKAGFQFLIGRLRTFLAVGYSTSPYLVSIPHR